MALQKERKVKPISTLFASVQQTQRHISHYLTTRQKRELIVTLNVNCYVVLEQYLYKAYIKSSKFDDKTVSQELGLSVYAIQRARQLLTKAEWFWQHTYNSRGAHPILATAIGKKDVRMLKKDPAKVLTLIQKNLQETTTEGGIQ